MLDRVPFNGVSAAIAYPTAEKAPALVLLQEYWGLNAQILAIAGERKLIGGQEDQLIDIALMLKAKQDAEVGTTA